MKPLNLQIDGASYHKGLATKYLPTLLKLTDSIYDGKAGKRIVGHSTLENISSEILLILSKKETNIGQNYNPVRAILFDKNPKTNWVLGWHQDRTICVKEKLDIHNYGPWTVKQGYHHVEPPFSLLEDMITIRIHLDDVTIENAPLLIARGTHKLGKVKQDDIPKLINQYEEYNCLAELGDVWVYSTPILHASKKSKNKSRRRVIQIDFSKNVLDNGLEFLGI